MSRETLQQGSVGADVRTLQTLLNTLGTNIAVDGVFGEATDEAVRDFQAWRDLVEDGVVGPLTWTELDACLTRHLHLETVNNADRLLVAGRKAIERALAAWQSDITDPPVDDTSDDAVRCKAFIDACIRKPTALGWSWENPYKGDGDFQWCGAFAAFCWPDVKAGLRQLYFSSTLRLDRYASYRSYNGEINEGAGRLYQQLDENSVPTDLAFEPRQGDILIIGPGRPQHAAVPASWHAYGNHICLVESFDASRRIFRTLEGNGNGVGPHGEKQQGVVKGVRSLGGPGWHARRLIRPAIDDLG